MTAVLIEILLKSALVAGTAFALVMQLKSLPAAQRAWIAHMGLLLTLAMPLLVVLGPDLELAGPWSRSVAAAVDVQSAALTPGAAVTAEIAPAAQSLRLAPGLIALIGWSLGAGVLLLGLVVGLARLLRLQRDASVLTDRDWLGALAQAQHRMGLKQGTALLRSERVSSPISWGLLRPTIVLSPAALRAPEKAEAILAHELAHVVRMDWLNLLIARLATVVFWFNPLVWLLAWQAHELREEAADDVVLRGDVRGTDYAALLVGFARDEQRLEPRGALAAHGVAPGKHSLRRRLLRVLDGDVRRDPARPLWIAGCAAAALVVAAPLAAFTPVDRVSEPTDAGAAPLAAAAGEAAGFPSAPIPSQPVAVAAGAPVAAANAGVAVAVEPGPQAGPGADDPAADSGSAVVRPAGRLSPDLLAQMRLHGVTPEWIAALEREYPGVRSLSARQMVGLAVHRVSPGWIRSLREAGYGDLDYEQMTALAVHRITPAYIRELESAGYRDLPVDQLVAFRIHGVDGAYIRRMEAEGLRSDPLSAIRRETKRERRRSRAEVPEPPAPPAPPPPAPHS